MPTPLGPFPYPRAWASVDGQFFGHTFHYINTHLESFDANIRELQGGELRAGPANTPLPLIIAMDSNGQAFPLPQDPTYTDFISAGYNDVWSENQGTNPPERMQAVAREILEAQPELVSLQEVQLPLSRDFRRHATYYG